MAVAKQHVLEKCFNSGVRLPYELRLHDFTSAMQDVYDFFFDVNSHLTDKGLGRLEDTLRKANLSGTLSDMVAASLAKHSRVLTQNRYHNGHPDLIVKGRFANDSVKAGDEGVEIKTTVKKGGAVDTHGAREQWLCVFVYEFDNETEPAIDRRPLKFIEVYLSHVQIGDFRKNDRGELGTRTATLHKEGIQKLRRSWVYLDLGPVDDTESEQGS
ncbi:MAG: hypothetical protein OXN95_00030 [bacterium]|nr:hypothetical protein [bacterium]